MPGLSTSTTSTFPPKPLCVQAVRIQTSILILQLPLYFCSKLTFNNFHMTCLGYYYYGYNEQQIILNTFAQSSSEFHSIKQFPSTPVAFMASNEMRRPDDVRGAPRPSLHQIMLLTLCLFALTLTHKLFKVLPRTIK